jgi:peptidoglycan/LPS O-acetylase OafA/YrhL
MSLKLPVKGVQLFPNSVNRLHQIDALRGLAAILVIIAHASESLAPIATQYGHSSMLAQFAQRADVGRIGVVIFFIISGFVVAHALGGRDATLAKFAVRRFFRLYPLYWLSIVLVIFYPGTGKYPLAPQGDHSALLANVTMLPTLLGFEPMMGIYWTLETELVFYLCAVVFYQTGQLFKPIALFWIIFALIGVFAAVMFGVLPAPRLLSWKSLPLNLAFMFWGALFHAVVFNRALQANRGKWKYLLLISAGLILLPSAYTFIRFFSSHSPDDLRWAVSYPAAVLGFTLIFFAKGRWTQRVSGLGVISYSMYLLHPLAFAMVTSFLRSHAIDGGMASLPFMTTVTIGIAVALSIMSYLLLEKPCIFLGRKLTAKFAHAT